MLCCRQHPISRLLRLLRNVLHDIAGQVSDEALDVRMALRYAVDECFQGALESCEIVLLLQRSEVKLTSGMLSAMSIPWQRETGV